MPRGDVAGTGSGPERRACDHSICLFELWSQEIGGPGTSAYYRKTLTVATTEPNPPSKGISLVLIGWTPSQEIFAWLSVSMATQKGHGFRPPSRKNLEAG
jgi:hypothetical protein